MDELRAELDVRRTEPFAARQVAREDAPTDALAGLEQRDAAAFLGELRAGGESRRLRRPR